MDERFARVELSLQSVNGTLTWINRLIIGGIIMGIIAFMVKGGFAP